MGIEEVTAVSSEALYLVIKVATPVLLVSFVVGLIISIFQTVTSIQEQTLTFVPKIIAVFFTLIVLGHWMLNEMTQFMIRLWSDFPLYIR
mgnify:CR=1 FL=1